MKHLLLAVSVVILASCGGKSGTKYYPATAESLSKFVNDKALTTATPNLSLDKSIVNNEYPIQIALYKDHRFYYDLPNLGDGTGTWEFKDGQIVLKAKRTLFDMKINVHATDEAVQNVAIEFTDRFGPNVLRTEKQNIE